MQKLLVVQWFEQWWLKPETLSSILVRSGVSLSFYFPHKMFVAAKINFVGVLVECNNLSSLCITRLMPRLLCTRLVCKCLQNTTY